MKHLTEIFSSIWESGESPVIDCLVSEVWSLRDSLIRRLPALCLNCSPATQIAKNTLNIGVSWTSGRIALILLSAGTVSRTSRIHQITANNLLYRSPGPYSYYTERSYAAAR